MLRARARHGPDFDDPRRPLLPALFTYGTRRGNELLVTITAEQVKLLRDRTGVGMMECKGALVEAQGDIEAAITVLRKRGLVKAADKGSRATSEGLVGHYIHMGGKIGVLVELNCETDFVARTDAFKDLAKEIAMHIAAANPTYVKREDVPADRLEHERSIYRAQMEGSGKPPAVMEKIVEGKLVGFFEQTVLVDQASIRDPKVTIGQMVSSAVAKLGENITVRRFIRWKVGEEV